MEPDSGAEHVPDCAEDAPQDGETCKLYRFTAYNRKSYDGIPVYVIALTLTGARRRASSAGVRIRPGAWQEYGTDELPDVWAKCRAHGGVWYAGIRSGRRRICREE